MPERCRCIGIYDFIGRGDYLAPLSLLAKLKQFPEMGSSMRNKYGLDCDYYVIFIEHNYFIYRITDEMILILEIFNEREDFMRQMFGIVTTPQETLDYWGE